MRRAFTALILLILTAAPSLARNVTTFEDGKIEVVAELRAPECRDTIYLKVPAECHILNATMNVSALLPDGSHPGCPEAVRVSLDDTLLWEFNGTGYGALGMQDKFMNGTAEWKSGFGQGGGNNSTTLRLPDEAVVRNATMEMGCNGTGFDQNVNFTGAAAGDLLGSSVSDAGDVNNDGYGDVIAGAPSNDAAGNNAGRAYIFFGGAGMDSIADVILTGAAAGDSFGGSVSGAGDVNNDGYDDVVVGAYNNDAGGLEAGRAYIYYGGASMDTTADVILTGAAAYDTIGYSVSGAGDVNKDGYDDVVVGSYETDAGGTNAGRAFIFYGGASMDSAADVTLTGEAAYDKFGRSVSDAGDVDKDGFDDFIVGAPFNDAGGNAAGRAYIYFGAASMDSIADVTLTGAAGGDRLGFSVFGGGDVNKDGYDDVVVGAPENDTGGTNAGRSYVFLGGAGMDSTADVILPGAAAGDEFGWSVAGAFDLNKDGYDDVFVATPYDGAGGDNAGRAYVFFGGATMDGTADVILTGAAAGVFFGISVSGAGDVDKDGYDDLVVGAPYDGAGGAYAGSAIVFAQCIGVREIGIFAGSISIWNRSGYFNGTDPSRDFGPELDQLLRNSPPSGTDLYGNGYVDVSVQVIGKSAGNVTLRKVKIVYTLETTVLDFTDILNQYINTHKAGKDAGGNLSVPVSVASKTPGRLELNDLLIVMDEAPKLIKPVPDVGLQEDSASSVLLDLHEYFEDDYDTIDQLTFSVISATNGSFVKVEVAANRFVSADASGGEPNGNWTGEVEAVVGATDSSGSKSPSNLFHIVVTNVNDAPVITSRPNTNGTVGQEYLYQVVAVDGDNDSLTYELTRKPENMTIGEGTGAVRWIPSKHGDCEITVSVSDGQVSVSQDFRITVPNRPPRIVGGAPPGATAGNLYSYATPATDDDGDVLTYILKVKPEGMVLDPASGVLSWTPNIGGTFPVSVDISDGISTINYNFTVIVMYGNRAPVFSSVPATSAVAGLPWSYSAKAEDPENDPVGYSLAASPPGMVIDGSSGRASWTPATAGNYTVKFKASDGKGGDGVQEFTIRVADRVKPNVQITNPSENAKVRGRLTVTGTVTRGTLDIIQVQVRFGSGSWQNATGNPSWRFGQDTTKLRNGVQNLQVRAYDGAGYSDVVSRNINVSNSKSGGKGFIPGFGAFPLLIAAAALLVLGRKWK